MPDNYEIQLENVRGLFLKYDQKAMIRRLSLESNSRYIYIKFLNREWKIERLTGLIQDRHSDADADFSTAMSIYDYICRDDPVLPGSGRKAPVNSILASSHAGVGESAIYDAYPRKFSRTPESFRQACMAMGGRPYPRGDIAYEFTVFEGLELVVQLWLADEEFPASMTLLWDEHVLGRLMYETTWYVCGSLLRNLSKLMDGISEQGTTWFSGV